MAYINRSHDGTVALFSHGFLADGVCLNGFYKGKIEFFAKAGMQRCWCCR